MEKRNEKIRAKTAAGRDRIRFTARFRVSDQALGGKWRMFGYAARDQDGNLPVAPWHELLEGWPIEVNNHVATSITSAASDQVEPYKTRLDSIYPESLQSGHHDPLHALGVAARDAVGLHSHGATSEDAVQRNQEQRESLRDVGYLRPGFGRLPVQADRG